MEDARRVMLLEKFDQQVEVLTGRIAKLTALSATRDKVQPLPRAKPVTLLDIPLEIRLQIYQYCIHRNRIVEVSRPHFDVEWPSEGEDDTQDVWEEDDVQETEEWNDTQDFESGTLDPVADFWNTNNNNNSLFLVSKQISEEALDFLYGQNMFKLHLHGEGEYLLRENFSERNRLRMRCMLVVARPMGVTFTPGRQPDDALWSSILPNLTVFRLVAQQPLHAAGYYNAPTLEQDIDSWLKWISPFLKCFGQYLCSAADVQVDDDGRKETSELVEAYLSNRYRKVRCRLAGDLVFERGNYSFESGYWDDDGPINCRDIVSDYDSD